MQGERARAQMASHGRRINAARRRDMKQRALTADCPHAVLSSWSVPGDHPGETFVGRTCDRCGLTVDIRPENAG